MAMLPEISGSRKSSRGRISAASLPQWMVHISSITGTLPCSLSAALYSVGMVCVINQEGTCFMSVFLINAGGSLGLYRNSRKLAPVKIVFSPLVEPPDL